MHDWWDINYYNESPFWDPPGPGPGTARINRGGNWYTRYSDLRTARRSLAIAGSGGADPRIGIRLARTAN